MSNEDIVLKYIIKQGGIGAEVKTSHILVHGKKEGLTANHVKAALNELHKKGRLTDPHAGTNLKNKFVRVKI